MDINKHNEAHITKAHNVLIALGTALSQTKTALSEMETTPNAALNKICAETKTYQEVITTPSLIHGKTVYLYGDITQAKALNLHATKRVYVIEELSTNLDKCDLALNTIKLGQVPILVHNLGIYYRSFFDTNINYFKQISTEHAFQSLTESTKAGTALRTGIYLTPVEKINDELHFRLLRCSTNLTGPTENFRATDTHIVNALNQTADTVFHGHSPLNHVLAQIYHNKTATEAHKQSKAKISSHADKTKDMPAQGIMAFCTFYQGVDKLTPLSPLDITSDKQFDYGYKGVSGLTKLHFRLKNTKENNTDQKLIENLPQDFTVTLYPNSVFFMPLSTNRFYTHEIKSSVLDAGLLPTRLGYVVRCSNMEAVHKQGSTFLRGTHEPVKLEPPTEQGMQDLRKIYARENKEHGFISYNNAFNFSMNQGDYKAPEYKMQDEFHQYQLAFKDNIYEQLRGCTQFEAVIKGRQGGVLTRPHPSRGTPIVRTTTKYSVPAQAFHPLHLKVAQAIQQRASLPFTLNNALIEHYSNAYCKMGFHSDQALDLQENSHIAIFSCYQNPTLDTPLRRLVIEPKDTSGDTFEIPLTHNSVIVFSLATNQRFKHKIVLDTSAQPPENPWLGITFRTSKTFICYEDEHTYFEDGRPLTIANEEEQQEFYALRKKENNEIEFTYPAITYTISDSDILSPQSIK